MNLEEAIKHAKDIATNNIMRGFCAMRTQTMKNLTDVSNVRRLLRVCKNDTTF